MKLQKISEFGEAFNGKTPSKSEQRSTGFPILKIRDIDENGEFKGSFNSYVDEEFYKKHSSKKLRFGDTIILNAAHNSDYVGNKSAMVTEDLEGVLATGEWLIVRSTQANPAYVNFFLKSNEGKRRLKSIVKGIHLYPKDVLRVKIPIPSSEDQIRIAHLLSKVDSLITQRKQHLQQLDELLKSIFLDMFGPTTQEFEEWPLVEIKDLAESHKGSMRTGPFGSNLLHSEFTEDGDVAVLGIDNAVQNHFTWSERRYITTKKYEELKNYTIYPGDVIVTIMGTIGRSAVIPDGIPLAINTKHLAAITLNKKIANPVFISYSIHSSPFILDQFKSKNRGAIMSGLNLTLIKETKLRRPPIKLQNLFEKIHNQVDRIRHDYKSSLSDLESLYGALNQKAFKGELDLSNIPLIDSSIESKRVSNDNALDKLEKQLEIITKPIKHIEKISRITQTPNIPALDAVHRVTEPFEKVASITTPIERAMQHLRAIPDLSVSFKPLKSEKVRQQWIDGTLNDHLSDLNSQDEFSVDQLMQTFQRALEDIESDDELDSSLLTSSYDQVRNWIFEQIKGGLLTQDFDSDNNQLTLRKA